MELSFVANAVRRYLWVVILCASLGALPGLLLSRSDTTRYESQAAMLLAPESQLPGAATDRDRYIASQLSVLNSESLAEVVRDRVDDELTTDEILASVSFLQVTGSDVVVVGVTADTPERAQAIANAYLDAYVEQLQEQVDAAVGPDEQRLADQAAAIQEQLDEVDRQTVEAMQPYLNAAPAPGTDTYPPIPPLDQVAPSLVTAKAVLLAELTQVATERTALGSTANDRVVSAVFQRATDPDPTFGVSSNRLVAVGIIGGAFIGMLLAVLLARLSPRVMGDFEVEDILGQQMVGEMARVREFRASPRAAFGNLPTDVMAVTNELCVRIESSADDDTSLTVVVVGSRRRAGTSTLAASIAARFAMNGLEVLLIDADRRHPQLSSFEFATSERPDEREARKQLDRSGPLGAVKSTPLPRLSVASVRAFEGAGPMRRQDVIDLLDAGTSIAQVVVVDGGPLLASASTVQLTRVASAIVLAVPHRESVRSLAELAKELRDRTVFAVWTPSRRGFAAPPRTLAPDAVRDTPEPVETDDIEATVGSRK